MIVRMAIWFQGLYVTFYYGGLRHKPFTILSNGLIRIHISSTVFPESLLCVRHCVLCQWEWRDWKQPWDQRRHLWAGVYGNWIQGHEASNCPSFSFLRLSPANEGQSRLLFPKSGTVVRLGWADRSCGLPPEKTCTPVVLYIQPHGCMDSMILTNQLLCANPRRAFPKSGRGGLFWVSSPALPRISDLLTFLRSEGNR